MVLFKNSKNSGYESSFIFSFLVHSCALTLGFGLVKYQKLPLVIPFAAFNILSYAIAPMLVDFKNFQLDVFDPSNLDITNIGFLILYGSYFIVCFFRQETQVQTSRVSLVDLGRLQFVFLLLYLVSFFFGTALQFLHIYFLQWLLGVLVCGYLEKKNGRIANFLLLGVFVFELSSAILSSMIFSLFYLILFVLLVIFIFNLKVKNNYIIIVIVLFGALYFASSFSKVKMSYRTLDFTNTSSLEKAIVIVDLLNEAQENELSREDGENDVLWRLTYPLSGLSHVRNKTPVNVPYWNGESYLPILYKFIPRVIWADKPKEIMGQTFGHRYNILAGDNLTTSMNCPMVAEAYMNFGMLGLWSFFVLYGVLLGSFYLNKNLMMNQEDNRDIEILNRINICIVAIYFLQLESNFSMFFGKLIMLLVVMRIVRLSINNRAV